MEISTGQGTVAVLWEGNRRSGFALAEHHTHRICHISTYRLNGLRRGDEHPTNTPVRCIALYYFNVLTLFPGSYSLKIDLSAHVVSVNPSLKIEYCFCIFSESIH